MKTASELAKKYQQWAMEQQANGKKDSEKSETPRPGEQQAGGKS